MLKLYLEILDPKRKEVFEKLTAFGKDGFLAGGTALALQLDHRKSFDFDIFLPKQISSQFYRRVLRVFGQETRVRIKTGDLLLIQTSEGIDVHFVYYWYKDLFPRVKTSSIDLSTMADIAANKALTIGQRGQWRDYVDVFFLLKKGVFNFEKIMEMARKKYKSEFNPRLFLEQLAYFGDIADFNITYQNESYSVEEVENFLIKTVKDFDIKKSQI
ncbi:MAG: nucleotidyl transferase AbiEii/AbiGii toxin family protein [Patescibacteria group bacterium]|nr:nucleotidyl transferase AbiEii/AbiGii toxin family protein [Patescibacteria group bacterium]